MKKNTMTLMAAGVCAAVVAQVANAAVVVGWTIPTAFPTGAGNVPIGTSYSVGIGDQGAAAAGTNLSSVHQLASSGAQNTSYTSPACNSSRCSGARRASGSAFIGGVAGLPAPMMGPNHR